MSAKKQFGVGMWLASRIWGWDLLRSGTKSFPHTGLDLTKMVLEIFRNGFALHKKSSYFFSAKRFLVWWKIELQKTDIGFIFDGENFFALGKTFRSGSREIPPDFQPRSVRPTTCSALYTILPVISITKKIEPVVFRTFWASSKLIKMLWRYRVSPYR